MTGALIAQLVALLLTAAVVVGIYALMPDRRRSWRPLPEDLRVREVEAPREVDHE